MASDVWDGVLLVSLGGLRFATTLSAMRWAEDYHLFILGTLSFAAASLGRAARRGRWHNWVRYHISGMGLSYVLLVTAFYVDNGKSLPLWKELPSIAYWLLPAAVGIPLIVRALTAVRTNHSPFRRSGFTHADHVGSGPRQGSWAV